MGERKIYYGWFVVGAVFIISAYVSGIVSFGFTAVVDPIAKEFGWSYASISIAGSIRGFEIGLLAPLVGILVDRLGPQQIGFQRRAPYRLWIVCFIPLHQSADFLFCLCSHCRRHEHPAMALSPLTVVGHWFRQRVSLVTGVVVSGVAFGGFFVSLVAFIIDSFGWRTAMTGFGIGAWAICAAVGVCASPATRHQCIGKGSGIIPFQQCFPRASCYQRYNGRKGLDSRTSIERSFFLASTTQFHFSCVWGSCSHNPCHAVFKHHRY